jgi:hypothetical protein
MVRGGVIAWCGVISYESASCSVPSCPDALSAQNEPSMPLTPAKGRPAVAVYLLIIAMCEAYVQYTHTVKRLRGPT